MGAHQRSHLAAARQEIGIHWVRQDWNVPVGMPLGSVF